MKDFMPGLISVIPVPVIMIIFGVLWAKHPPKNINWIYGYRSIRSMKNANTWKFAHLYQARLWGWSGGVLFSTCLYFLIKL